MKLDHVEVEVKIRVDDFESLTKSLLANGAKLSAERVYERNVRYEDATNSLSPDKRVLRLRQDTRARLTYKEPHSTGGDGVTARTELEVTVSDFDTADLLLAKLGFHSAWVYEKYRTSYELLGCEVVLDELPIGKFVEVEGDSIGIEKVLSVLNLSESRRILESYSGLFFALKARLRLDFEDLTFENFKGWTPSTLGKEIDDVSV